MDEYTFRPRGLGLNWLPCFISGHQPKHKCQADMAFFIDPDQIDVSSVLKDPENPDKPFVHHPIMDLFHEVGLLVGKLDYRPSEPHWVQLKLGASGPYVPNLQLLGCLARENGNKITKAILESVIPGRLIP